MAAVPKPLASPEQVSEFLGVSIQTLYKWRLRSEGPTAIPVGKYLRYRWSEVEAWLKAQEEEWLKSRGVVS